MQRLLEIKSLFKNIQNPKCLLSSPPPNILNQELDSYYMHCFLENLEELFERLHLSCTSQFKVILISEFSILSHFAKTCSLYLKMTILMHLLPICKYKYSAYFPFSLFDSLLLISSKVCALFGNLPLKIVLPQNIPLWPVDYFELKAIEKKEIPKKKKKVFSLFHLLKSRIYVYT